MEDQLRPEFLKAIGAAFWNGWFWLAYAIPFAIVIPASFRRWGGCVVAPIALVACWVAYAKAIDVYDDAFEQNAVTQREWGAVAADTGRNFAPFFRGTPIAIFLTGIAVATGSFLRRMLMRKQNNVPASPINTVIDEQAVPTALDPNPYSPPRRP